MAPYRLFVFIFKHGNAFGRARLQSSLNVENPNNLKREQGTFSLSRWSLQTQLLVFTVSLLSQHLLSPTSLAGFSYREIFSKLPHSVS